MSKHTKHHDEPIPEETLEESRKTLEKYREEAEALKEKAASFSGEMKTEFNKRLAEMESLYGEMQSRYASLKDKTETKWEDAKAFVNLTNKALVHSYHYFISHYRKKGE